MKLIALEEAFSVPKLEKGLLQRVQDSPVRDQVQKDWDRRLADFTEYRIPDMDANGIDVQVLSLVVPGAQRDMDTETSVDYVRKANDFLAEVIERHPTRFRGFAALPTQDGQAAADELKRCVTELGFCGALVNDHTQGHYLDEDEYEPLWTMLESLDRPLYLHPGAMPADQWHILESYPEMHGPLWSWQAETGGHAMRILLGGVFDRHPGARLILGHAGEFLPFQRFRMDSRYRTVDPAVLLRRPPSEYFGTNILVTTSGVFSPASITAMVAEMGAESVLFSIDYPYEDSAEAVAGLARADLSDEDRAKISYGNAQRILHLDEAL